MYPYAPKFLQRSVSLNSAPALTVRDKPMGSSGEVSAKKDRSLIAALLKGKTHIHPRVATEVVWSDLQYGYSSGTCYLPGSVLGSHSGYRDKSYSPGVCAAHSQALVGTVMDENIKCVMMALHSGYCWGSTEEPGWGVGAL